MPVNEPKPVTPEALVTEVINNFFSGFGAATNKTTETPTVDPVAEANRLLKKAEESADNATPSYTSALLEIADRHIRIIDLALSTQR